MKRIITMSLLNAVKKTEKVIALPSKETKEKAKVKDPINNYNLFVLKPEEIRFQGRLTKKGFIFEFWKHNNKSIVDNALQELQECFSGINPKEYKDLLTDKFNSLCVNAFTLQNSKAGEKVTINEIRDKIHIQWIDFKDMLFKDLLSLEFDYNYKPKRKG